MSKIFSPGKLMLTSEYFAMDGALVLVVPTQKGQELLFEEENLHQSLLYWESYCLGKRWLYAKIDYQNWEILETDDQEAAQFVMKVLKNVQQLSTHKLQNTINYRLETHLQFPKNYGLGSSSTLMNNLAVWAEIDPFELNGMSLVGSGYDVAVAKEHTAILYRNENGNRSYKKVIFSPPFQDELIFIHLNQKQDSREGIALYRSKEKSPSEVEAFTQLTYEIFQSQDLENFSQLMTIHEKKVSDFIGLQTVKEKYFENCPSFVKSLGAWGGDFVMARKFPGYAKWFSERGFSTIFSWKDIIL